MDERENEICPNCNREVPKENFTIHSVHCARNFRSCPVCKEPVLLTELEEHHEKLHTLQSCKQCGEKVCGTDMEDHIRDSCAHTIQSCRWCDLELKRLELPVHEGYCGARTAQCPDCGEYVMLKYRQLHLDTNHGFVRLDDDPVPNRNQNRNRFDGAPRGHRHPFPAEGVRIHFQGHGPRNILGVLRSLPIDNADYRNAPPMVNFGVLLRQAAEQASLIVADQVNQAEDGANAGGNVVLQPLVLRRAVNITVQRPQGNVNNRTMPKRTGSGAQDKVNKDATSSRGAVKKRPAPRPPGSSTSAETPSGDVTLQQSSPTDEGVQSPGESMSPASPSVSPTQSPVEPMDDEPIPDPSDIIPATPSDVQPLGSEENRENVPQNRSQGKPKKQKSTHAPPAIVQEIAEQRNTENDDKQVKVYDATGRRVNLKNVRPMTSDQFMTRFRQLNLEESEDEGEEDIRDRVEEDRIDAIKSSLKKLRQGLNEVTAPYNNNNYIVNVRDEDRKEANVEDESNDSDDSVYAEAVGGAEEGAVAGGEDIMNVHLPCEFCGELVLARDLVQHQTGCRPDLVQLLPVAVRSSPLDNARNEAVIPCEFCTESLPLYLISDHQKRCGREANLLFPD